MSLYAEIKDNVVVNIIVADQNFIDLLDGNFVEYTMETPLVGYGASIGFTFDKNKNVFITPKCHDKALLDETTCRWICTNSDHDVYLP
jgi:hypothetical protein